MIKILSEDVRNRVKCGFCGSILRINGYKRNNRELFSKNSPKCNSMVNLK